MKKQAKTFLSLLLCAVLLLSAALPAFAATGKVKTLKASEITPKSVTLKWSAVSGAARYELQTNTANGWRRLALTNERTRKITGLTLGNTYQYRVRALRSNGEAGAFSPVLKVKAAPAVVTNLRVTAKSATAVNLAWSKVAAAKGYRVQQYNGKSWVTVVKATKKTVVKITSLKPDTVYKFRVCAYAKTANGYVFGSYCKRVAVRTAAIGIPTALKAAAVKDTSLTLKWKKVSGVNGYVVYRVNGDARAILARPTTNSYTVTGLTAGTDYMFSVRSVLKTAEKNNYSPFSANLFVRTAPAAVKDLQATMVADTYVTLGWSKIKNAEGYQIWKESDGKWTYLGVTNKTSYTVEGLESLQSYRFYVRAYHTRNGATLASANSNILRVSTLKGAVSGFALFEATGNSLSLVWDKLDDAVSYMLEIGTNNKSYTKVTAPQMPNGNRMTVTVPNLKANTAYYLRLTAVFSDGMGVPSNLKAKTAPGVTSALTANGAVGGVSLGWVPVSGASGYEVSKSIDQTNWEVICTTVDANCSIDGLDENVRYSFRVRAFYTLSGVNHYGGYSAIATAGVLPPSVRDLAVSQIGTNSFRIAWTAQTNAQSYQISLSENGGSFKNLKTQPVISGSTASMTVTDLTAGNSYTVQITALVNGTESAPTQLHVTTLPAQVTGLTAKALSGSQIQLSWNGMNGALYYEVQQLNPATAQYFKLSDSVQGTSYVASSLTANTNYTFRVRALNQSNGSIQAGAFSADATATTTGQATDPTTPTNPTDPTTSLSAPTGLSATPSQNSVSLRWNAVTGADGYEITYSAGTQTTASTSYTVSSLAAGTSYTFRVRAYQGSGTAKVYSAYANVSATTTGGSSTTPSTGDTLTPSTSTKITGITLTTADSGMSFGLKWNTVQNAVYHAEKWNASQNRWETILERSNWERLNVRAEEQDLSIRHQNGSDQKTTFNWSAVTGASSYQLRTEIAENSGKWFVPFSATGTSASIFLSPGANHTVRVSAIGSTKIRIFALSAENSSQQLAYTEYTASNVPLAYDDCALQVPALTQALQTSSSDGLKEAYTLMLVQAINNTRFENDAVSMKAATDLTAAATKVDTGSSLLNGKITDEDLRSMGLSESSTLEARYVDNYTESATSVTVTDKGTADEKTTRKTGVTSWLFNAITPSEGMTYLYNQNDLNAFKKGVKSVTASTSGNTTTVKITLNTEAFSDTVKTYYHPGFLNTIADNASLLSQFDKGTQASVGETTITAKINKNSTLDALDIVSPFTMNVATTQSLTGGLLGSLTSMTIRLTLVGSSDYHYTFTR